MNGGKFKSAGFTLLELVIVIATIGLLAAVAVPRFINVTEESHTASAAGAATAFEAGVNLAAAQWRADGQPGSSTTIEGETVGMSATTGKPSDTCANMWNALIRTSYATTTTFTPGADSFWILSFFGFCFYIYLPDTTPLRYFYYTPANGNLIKVNI